MTPRSNRTSLARMRVTSLVDGAVGEEIEGIRAPSLTVPGIR